MINVTRSSMPDFEEYCAEIRNLWDTCHLSNGGTKHDELKKMLEAELEVPDIVLYCNGHLSLETALDTFQFPRGSEVITTPFTFISTTHALVRKGLVPVFGDIKPDDFTLDPAGIEKLITPRTRAILPVHIFGHVCDDRGIGEIARRHHLKVIYDAAEAFGVRKNGRSVAAMGDAAIYSFHATKVFHTVEGGAVCCHDPELAERAARLRNYGIEQTPAGPLAGGNAKMNEFQAAMGLCSLRILPRELAKRRAADARYRRQLTGVPGLQLCTPPADVTPNYAYFPVLITGNCGRDQLYDRLLEAGITAKKYFWPLTSSVDYFPGVKRPILPTPVAERVSRQILVLPLYADLSMEDIDRICGLVTAALK